jgi:NitT/TauT family transport system substrate-binding protein
MSVAIATQGSSGEIVLDGALKPLGLSTRDLNTVVMAFPDVPAALAGGSIDAAMAIEPFLTNILEKNVGALWKNTDEISPNFQAAVVLYGPFMNDQPDVARRFMVAYVRALRDYNDAFRKGVGRTEVAQILAKYTTVKDLTLYDRITPAGLDPDGRMNVQGVRDDIAFYVRLGCITGEIADVGQVVDESYIDYAVSVLGPYQR